MSSFIPVYTDDIGMTRSRTEISLKCKKILN